MIIRNRTTNGLKGQYLIAQGNALGTGIWVISPCKGKSKDAMIRLLPLQGVHRAVLQPRALPWAKSILPLWGASGMIADNHLILYLCGQNLTNLKCGKLVIGYKQ